MTLSSPPYNFAYSHRENRGCPTVLLLHGFMGDKEDWAGVADALSPEFSTLAVDLPGHGETVVNEAGLCRMENCAAGLVELIKELEMTECHVVAYSMGGRLALYLAVNFPREFKSFVIESGSPGLKSTAERSDRIKHDKRLAERLDSEGLERFLNAWYRLPLFASLDKDSPGFKNMLRRRRKGNPAGIANSLRFMGTGTQPPLWHRLDSVRVPMILITGELDKKFDRIAGEMSDLCPRFERAIIPDGGHNVHFEKPLEYSRCLLEFLKKNS
jgi:2-succinyl-6-hydroxy-2,4-cyclohexadiene-1-carboxylate synthase